MLNKTLFIAATPIGNLDDISQNLINKLETIEYIFCEDTRNTKKLLGALKIKNNPKLFSYHNFNEQTQIEKISDVLMHHDVLLVSDAGYPNISDPGFCLINYCLNNQINIEVINGPCALIHAIVKSGFSTKTFMFLGFMDPKKQQQINLLSEIKKIKTTFIFYESVHKILHTLLNIAEVFANNNICVCKELTKVHETFFYGTAKEIITQLNNNNLKGEFVILIDNNQMQVEQQELIWQTKVDKLIELGLNNKTILEILLLDFSKDKKAIYNYLISKNKR